MDSIDGIEHLMNRTIEVLEIPNEVAISDVLTPDEMPDDKQKEIQIRRPAVVEKGLAFHEKKEKNKKVNVKITRAQRMKTKYKKPKSRGGKRK